MARQLYGGRWRVDKPLGQGGQGVVFLVTDLTAEESTPVVLKRILNPRRAERFVAEVTACKTLTHPNIIRLLDHSALDGSGEEKMYLVMPHMDAGNLEERAAMYRGSVDSTLEVALKLAEALGHAHSKGVIHRDVKPANILFAERNNEPTLADFGICLIRDEPRTTETGEVVGPRAFMAPELEGGGRLEATPAADVYSLGKVIYFMLAGGTVLPRERQAEAKYDIFTGKGLRHELVPPCQRACDTFPPEV